MNEVTHTSLLFFHRFFSWSLQKVTQVLVHIQ